MMASPAYFLSFTPKTNIGVSSLLGADMMTFFAPASMCFCAGFLGQEQAGRFDHDVGADLAPLQVGRVALLRQADLLAVDDQRVAVDARSRP